MNQWRGNGRFRAHLRLSVVGIAIIVATMFVVGCHRHRASVTAVPLSPWNQCEPEGIPYYLPKPLLVVAKNVRHIDETKVGLTAPVPIPNGFDNQASYADIKANVTVPGSGATTAATGAGNAAMTTAFDSKENTLPDIWEKMTPSARVEDGVAPDSFYTYQIVFIPDLSQKYGLRIKGGPGEMRAAMNLVNGWMYTGMGPFYLKDSSTAQNMMAFGVASMFTGRGVADVLGEVGEIAKIAGSGQSERAPGEVDEILDSYAKLARALQSQTLVPQEMLNYAQITIYEPQLQPDGTTGWTMVAEHSFDRHYFQPSMSESGINLFKLILEAEEHRKSAGASSGTATDAETAPGGPPNPARANPQNGTSERAADEPDDISPAPVIDMEDQSMNQLERKIFGIPIPQAQMSPAATELNINVGQTDGPRKSHSWKDLNLFRPKERAKLEQRATLYQEQNSLNPAGSPARSNFELTLPGGFAGGSVAK